LCSGNGENSDDCVFSFLGVFSDATIGLQECRQTEIIEVSILSFFFLFVIFHHRQSVAMRTRRRKEAKTLTGRVWLMENSTLLLPIDVVIYMKTGREWSLSLLS
jgi:hypothetical protein